MIDKEKLTHIFQSRFDKNGLNTLAFRLEIDYRPFQDLLKQDYISTFFEAVEKSDQMEQLVQVISETRPDIFRKGTYPKEYTIATKDDQARNMRLAFSEIPKMDRVALFELVSTEIKFEQIQSLYVALGLGEFPFDSNIALNKGGQARELIVLLDDEGRIPELKARLIDHYKGATEIEPYDPPPVKPSEEFSATIYGTLVNPSSWFDELMFDLGIKLGIRDFAIGRQGTFFTYCFFQHNRVDELVAALYKAEPAIDWLQLANRFVQKQPSPQTLGEQIALYLGTEGLKTLCFDYGLDGEDFVDSDQLASAERLLAFSRSANRFEELMVWLQRERPFVSWGDYDRIRTSYRIHIE